LSPVAVRPCRAGRTLPGTGAPCAHRPVRIRARTSCFRGPNFRPAGAAIIVAPALADRTRTAPAAAVQRHRASPADVLGPRAHHPASAPNAVRFQLPCRDSNPGHRPMAYPQMDKVDRRLAQARLEPVGPVVDGTAGRSCRERSGRRAGHVPACKGSVDRRPPGHAPARNWRRAPFACPPPVYAGEAPVPERQHGALVPSPPRDSGIAAGCQVVRSTWGYATPRATVKSWRTFLPRASCQVSV
jgi:hypothetical protein